MASIARENSVPEPVPATEPAFWDWSTLDAELRPRLVRLAVSRYRFSREEAEDLVQDVFELVWAKRPRVRNPAAYLRTSFYHRCADALRSGATRRRHESLETLVDDGAPDRMMAAVAVHGAYRRIGRDCRSLITSYVVRGDTLAEAADRNQCSVNAVWKRINRCLRELMRCL